MPWPLTFSESLSFMSTRSVDTYDIIISCSGLFLGLVELHHACHMHSIMFAHASYYYMPWPLTLSESLSFNSTHSVDTYDIISRSGLILFLDLVEPHRVICTV
jgi:hypothetical protein